MLRYPLFSLWAIALGSLLAACGSGVIPDLDLLKQSRQPGLSKLGMAIPEPMDEPTWAFEPEPDTYSDAALLDLRGLNEAIAGETGFVRRSDDGRDFVKGDGTPLRFWAINSEVWSRSPESLVNHAKFLAKRGVNMVRWHGNIPSQDEGAPLAAINVEERERLWQYVAAMKQEGIYLTLSPYYSLWMKPQSQWVTPRSGDDMHGLLFFDPELQAAYKEWLKQLLIPVNPHTGLALKDDPAIAILQLQNEDSLLFWTLKNLQGEDLALLQQRFGDWLKERYGSLSQAVEPWQGATPDEQLPDDLEAGLIRLYPLWELTQEPPPEQSQPRNSSGKLKRMADQTAFLTETMHQFNAEIVRFLREEIDTPLLINAGNWKTADPMRLNDAERYSYSVAEVIGVNRYYGSVHHGERSGWAITTGDRFTNQSVLTQPGSFPLNLKQVANYPMIVSESSWVPPLNYQSEGPFLISVFQSLTGIDGFYWFTAHTPQWRQPASANGHFPSIGKWVMNTPELMGNFPAAALMYRQGYIQSGQPVIGEVRSLDELWQRRSPLISETRSFDPNRDDAFVQRRAGGNQGIHPLSFLTGPVEVTYLERAGAGSQTPTAQVQPLDSYINPESHVIHSVTGEVMWDYEQGLCWVDAPKAQGVTGFLKANGTIELTDVSLSSDNHYGTLWVVPLDGEAIATSNRLLVQVGTRTRPTNWKVTPATWTDKKNQIHEGFEILSYGEAPWQIVETDMVFTLRNTTIDRAIALDMNGMPLNSLPITQTSEGISLLLPPTGKYVILEKST
ncbi:MAG: hypothetical protein F6K16_29910 [Symploca sp. SIO2B6]|nr:hypothetical protein [Symploca sp. SIO2B6]